MDEKINIFNYIEYTSFLNKMINTHHNVYGYKAQLAEAAGCQRSFISQVLAGSAHMTAEHAVGLGQFWNLTIVEKDYLLNLVLLARAGSKSLKDFLRQKIEVARKDQENLAKRIVEKTVLPEAEAATFYSNWQYLAITILLTIPQYRSINSIAGRLNLKDEFVNKSLRELEQMKLVIKIGSEWFPTSNTIHIPRESKFNSLNHSHWRNQAVQNSFLGDENAVHYTSVCSLSLTDAERLKQFVFKLIDESREIVAPSKEEELFCLTCDWFKI